MLHGAQHSTKSPSLLFIIECQIARLQRKIKGSQHKSGGAHRSKIFRPGESFFQVRVSLRVLSM